MYIFLVGNTYFFMLFQYFRSRKTKYNTLIWAMYDICLCVLKIY